jgi:hypothetical protein
MRLKSVYISQYNNLRDFTLSFDRTALSMSLLAKMVLGNLDEHQIRMGRFLPRHSWQKNERLTSVYPQQHTHEPG